MTQTFSKLMQDFRQATGNWHGGKQTVEAFITRYEVLARHAGGNEEDKQELTGALLDFGLNCIMTSMDLEGSKKNNTTMQRCNAATAEVFARLTKEDALHMMPSNAHQRVLETALALYERMDRAAGVITDTFYIEQYLQNATAVAGTLLNALNRVAPEGVKPAAPLTIAIERDIKPAPGANFKL